MQLTIFPLLSGLFVLFNHCAHVNALPKQVDASSFANLAPGYAQHGNYLLYGCDQTFNAEGLLDQTYNFLKTAISSASPSNPVYAAMFRDVPPAQVQAVLSNIIAGTPLSVASTAGGSAIPTIVCVNNQDPKLTSAWNYCQSEATGSFGVYSMHAVGTQYVYLCPRVNMLFLTPDNAFCGQIIDGGKTLTTPFNVAITKYTNLVHELVHLYVQDPPGLQPEVYLVNDCMALPPDQKVQNAQNYAFYVGYLIAGCTDFPTIVPVQPDRELLESGDKSAQAGNIDDALPAATNTCTDPFSGQLEQDYTLCSSEAPTARSVRRGLLTP